jgi:arsenite methyltransferase
MLRTYRGDAANDPFSPQDQVRSEHDPHVKPSGRRLNDADELRAVVREHYGKAATAAGTGCCGRSGGACGGDPGPTSAAFGHTLYQIGDREVLPEAALVASLGCGSPTAPAELRPGEVVLDLGSDGGIDVLLSARRVASTGKAWSSDAQAATTRYAASCQE